MATAPRVQQRPPGQITKIQWPSGGTWFSVEGAVGMQDDKAGIFTGFLQISFLNEWPDEEEGYFIAADKDGKVVNFDGNSAPAKNQITVYSQPDTPKLTKDIIKKVTENQLHVGYINHTFGDFPVKLWGFAWWGYGGEMPRGPVQFFFKSKAPKVKLALDSIDRPFTGPITVRVYKKGAIELVAANGKCPVDGIDIFRDPKDPDKFLAEIKDTMVIPVGQFRYVTIDLAKGKIS